VQGKVLILWLVCLTGQLAVAENLFFSNKGDDSFDGRTPATAKKTLKIPDDFKLNSETKIFLAGGEEHYGSLSISNIKGNSATPVSLTTYGEGVAQIVSSPGQAAITIDNSSYIEISNLVIQSGGGNTNGIEILTKFGNSKSINLHHLWISGFKTSQSNLIGGRGISIIGSAENSVEDLSIENVETFDNDYAGMQIDSRGSARHKNIKIRYNRSYRNHGIANAFMHSGNGIIVSQIEDVLIEYNEAFDNGQANTAVGGPVGIWAWDASRVKIRRNLSYNNRTAGGADGGGFDFDGGVTDSIIEENVSFNNDGAGFLLCTYKGSKPVKNIIVRNNLSINDGRKNTPGAILVYGEVYNSLFENNQVYFPSNEGPAVRQLGFAGTHVEMINNKVVKLNEALLSLNADYFRPKIEKLFSME
jgi:hypothetical protein